MSVDLIIYAVVAIGLVLWLRSILGTRHGEERTHSAPSTTNNEDLGKKLSGLSRGQNTLSDTQETIKKLIKAPTKTLSIRKEAEHGLYDIASADKSFEIKDYLNKIQDAFVIIVESFGEGDRDTLKSLLKDNVYNAFNTEILKREGRGDKQITEIHAIQNVEILHADLKRNTAEITVSFVAEESTVIYDESGDIRSGHPDRINEMRDVWVFTRDVKSSDPRWWLSDTKGDFDGDNDIIPDTA